MAEKAVRTRIDLVRTTIRERIAARSLAAGAKLPSVRALARTLRVSVSTVVEGYGRLAAEGTIVSRPGSGFYVADQIAPMALSAVGPKLDRAIDPLWISRQSLEAADDAPKPGCGWLPASWFPDASLRRALRALSRAEAGALTDYGSPLGLPALRQLVGRRLGERGVEAAPDRILLTPPTSPAPRWPRGSFSRRGTPSARPSQPGASCVSTWRRWRTREPSRRFGPAWRRGEPSGRSIRAES